MLIQKLLVGAAVVCACAGVASATVTKVLAFLPTPGAGDTENAQVDGTASLKFLASGFTRIHLQVSDLAANTTYSIIITSSAGETGVFQAFTTNDHGHATFMSVEGQCPQDHTQDAVVTIYIDSLETGTPGVLDPGEERAYGLGT